MLDEVKEIIEMYDKDDCCFMAKLANGSVYKADGLGVKPILAKQRMNYEYFKDAIIVDKVIGKAAAMLLIDSGAKFIHGKMMSEYAIKILEKYKVKYSYDKKVDFIINRTNDGMCPLEASVQHVEDLEIAFDVIVKKVNELMKKN